MYFTKNLAAKNYTFPKYGQSHYMVENSQTVLYCKWMYVKVYNSSACSIRQPDFFKQMFQRFCRILCFRKLPKQCLLYFIIYLGLCGKQYVRIRLSHKYQIMVVLKLSKDAMSGILKFLLYENDMTISSKYIMLSLQLQVEKTVFYKINLDYTARQTLQFWYYLVQ